MNAGHLQKLIFTLISVLRRFITFLTKTTRFPYLVKIGDLLLDAYFRYCGLSPTTVDLDGLTTIHILAPTYHNHRKPTLILLHGFGGDARWQFYPQIRSLSSAFNVYIPDLLFFGKSFTKTSDRTVENQAKCVMEGLKKGFDLGRCTVYSISYGGWVGYWMAEMYPEVVEKVVIVSSAIGFTEEQKRVHFKKLGCKIEDLLVPEGASDMRALIELAAYKYPVKWFPDFFLQQFIQVTQYKQQRRELIDHLLNQNLDSQHISPLTQEVLLIWGEQDRFFPPYMAYHVQRLLGRKTSVSIIKDCGHAVNLDAPHEVNELVKSFALH